MSTELICTVNISSVHFSAKSCKAKLAIGVPLINKNSGACVQLCTATDKNGRYYEIEGNLLKVFGKFISDGKFTLRFAKPQHDLIVKADSKKAKNFLSSLMQIWKGHKTSIPTLQPMKTKEIANAVRKLVITDRKKYPIVENFPLGIEILEVCGLKLTRIENRILRLSNLHTINFENNLVRSLPMGLSSMSSLTDLNLKSNKLTEIPREIFKGQLCQTLYVLNLSFNQLKSLPHSLTNLQNIRKLDISNNAITYLPFYIGKLSSLRELIISNNNIRVLPATYNRLNLQHLDVGGISFATDKTITNNLQCVSTLREICGLVCLKNGYAPHPSEVPATLCEYLKCYLLCKCHKVTFRNNILSESYVNLVDHIPSVAGHKNVTAAHAYCSVKCMMKYRQM